MHIKYVDLYTVSCNLEPIRIYGLVINLSITIVADRNGKKESLTVSTAAVESTTTEV
jgi:hypothetical protein